VISSRRRPRPRRAVISSAMSSAIPCGADVRGRRPRRQGIVTAPSDCDCHFPWTCVRALGVATTWSKVGLEIRAKSRPPENPVNCVGKCGEREGNGGGLGREMRLAVALGGPRVDCTIRTLRRAAARRRMYGRYGRYGLLRVAGGFRRQ
jgi:hypothetical protein